MSRNWLLYLDDLIASGEKIGRLVSGRSFETFCADEAAFDAVLFNLQVIGESVKNLPPEALAAIPEASDLGPARLRDLIAHHYFALDADIIWDVATTRVPSLLSQAVRVRELADRSGSETEDLE